MSIAQKVLIAFQVVTLLVSIYWCVQITRDANEISRKAKRMRRHEP